jgi:hypothetical protein
MARRRTPLSGDLAALSGRLGQLVGALRDAAGEAAARKVEAGESPLQTHVEFRVRGLGEAQAAAAPSEQRYTRRAPPARPQGQAPLIEVFDEAEAVLVVIEAPGCAEADLEVSLEGERLLVRARGALAQAAAPPGLMLERAERRFVNGVLSLRFNKEPL